MLIQLVCEVFLRDLESREPVPQVPFDVPSDGRGIAFLLLGLPALVGQNS